MRFPLLLDPRKAHGGRHGHLAPGCLKSFKFGLDQVGLMILDGFDIQKNKVESGLIPGTSFEAVAMLLGKMKPPILMGWGRLFAIN